MVQSSSILVAMSALSLVEAWTSSSLSPLTSRHSSVIPNIPPTYRRRTTFCSVQRSPFQETSTSSSKQSSQQESSSLSSPNFFPWISSSEDKQLMKASLQLNEEVTDETSSLYVSNESSGVNPLLAGGGAIAAIAAASLVFSGQLDAIASNDIIGAVQAAFDNPTAALEQVVQQVDSMGPLGPLYFGAAYTVAEILAIPAIPLTASAGYLFGPAVGTGVVLVSASIAATVSFAIGRTLLRDYVEGQLEKYPDFAKIDRAIGKEGFKLMLLLRLSPIFPFALSNYLYGATSINFPAFFWGTLFGFAPGTLAYVYTGFVGKALTGDGSESYPWFVYAGGLAVLAGLTKILADVATRAVEELEDEA